MRMQASQSRLLKVLKENRLFAGTLVVQCLALFGLFGVFLNLSQFDQTLVFTLVLWVFLGTILFFWALRILRNLIHERDKALNLAEQKSTFLMNMSHEIRVSLNSIIGFSDILGEGPLSPEQDQYLRTIHRSSDYLLRLLDDILDYSKIERGYLQVDCHPFDVRALHQDILNMFRIRCQKKGLAFRLELEGDIPPNMVGDSHRLRQILINLISNAIKFTEKGKISIRMIKKQSRYYWIIQDTGIGICKESLSRVFKVFSQENAGISRKYGGSGLGLAITKNLVELMGGEISVESQEGEGTKFVFTLPFEEAS